MFHSPATVAAMAFMLSAFWLWREWLDCIHPSEDEDPDNE